MACALYGRRCVLYGCRFQSCGWHLLCFHLDVGILEFTRKSFVLTVNFFFSFFGRILDKNPISCSMQVWKTRVTVQKWLAHIRAQTIDCLGSPSIFIILFFKFLFCSKASRGLSNIDGGAFNPLDIVNLSINTEIYVMRSKNM